MPRLSAALLVLFLPACGGGDDGDGVGGGGEAAETRLELSVWPEGIGTGEPQRYTLTCDPPGGDHPNPKAACAALERLGAEAFAPVPDDVACTQIYGGPMQAEVTGAIRGERVDALLAYNDGCEIARWDRLDQVVPRPGV